MNLDFHDEDDYDYQYGQCYFGSKCCHPSYHHYPYECYTAEMMEEQDKYYRELELAEKYPILDALYAFRDWLASYRSWNFVEWWQHKRRNNDSELPF